MQVLEEYKTYDLKLNIQKQILDNTINNDLIKRYPIKTSYQKAFLKLFMQKVYLKYQMCNLFSQRLEDIESLSLFVICDLDRRKW